MKSEVFTWITRNAKTTRPPDRRCGDLISDARVYGGIHFRTDQVAGADLGRAVGTAVYENICVAYAMTNDSVKAKNGS